MKRYIKASTQDRNKLNDLAARVEKVLSDAHIWAELWDLDYFKDLPVAKITFKIDGDWKHDHLYADDLVQENFDAMPRIDEKVLEDTGEDSYPATHTYYILCK